MDSEYDAGEPATSSSPHVSYREQLEFDTSRPVRIEQIADTYYVWDANGAVCMRKGVLSAVCSATPSPLTIVAAVCH
jgi:hypothetical protein